MRDSIFLLPPTAGDKEEADWTKIAALRSRHRPGADSLMDFCGGGGYDWRVNRPASHA